MGEPDHAGGAGERAAAAAAAAAVATAPLPLLVLRGLLLTALRSQNQTLSQEDMEAMEKSDPENIAAVSWCWC